ncbi:MAG: ATP-binding protein [Chloroflexota bacterium]|nr:ATP-binding protein [Chloroflexota bacterium]
MKHLGLHMYSGATPAIAELIANAWDADASRVDIEIPLGQPWTERSVIRVRDDGIGMDFSDCNDKFLFVGRNRRRETGQYTEGGRLVMGHKGLGKLGCFGIAELIEVRTVKGRWLTHFRMDYDEILRRSEGKLVAPYEPGVLHDESADERDGTTVILKRIQLQQAINEDRFRASMARHFAVLSSEFEVYVNGEILSPEELEYEFRFPESGEETEEIGGVGTVKWWVGFTPKPVEYEDARGIAVIVMGRLAQKPFFFDLKRGTTGQHGMRYMVGQVHADGLNRGEIDLVATGRQSLLWEDPVARPLLEWGEKKVRSLLAQWARLRREKRIRQVRQETWYSDRIARFPTRERRELEEAIDKLAAIEDIRQDRLEEMIEFLLKAYENEYFMSLIRELNAMDESAQDEILRLFAEWDVLEAVHIAQIVRGRVEVIRKFRGLIEARAREKPDMQEFLKRHPWLIDLNWDTLEHERSLDTLIARHFNLEKPDEGEGRRRPDFFCLAGAGIWIVVELKRPGLVVGTGELEQLERYVDFLRDHARQTSEPERRYSVHGRLIASELRPAAYQKRDRLRVDNMYFVTWDDLLRTAERLHRKYLDLVKSRAPEDDPRIQALERIDEEIAEEAVQ